MKGEGMDLQRSGEGSEVWFADCAEAGTQDEASGAIEASARVPAEGNSPAVRAADGQEPCLFGLFTWTGLLEC